MKNINLENIIKRNDSKVITTELDNELVMMDIENGNYIKLNKTGNAIWQLLKEPICVSSIIEILSDKYHFNKHNVEEEIMDYLEQLHLQGLIQLN